MAVDRESTLSKVVDETQFFRHPRILRLPIIELSKGRVSLSCEKSFMTGQCKLSTLAGLI